MVSAEVQARLDEHVVSFSDLTDKTDLCAVFFYSAWNTEAGHQLLAIDKAPVMHP